jgi:acetylornithine deacetylase/succinyl-diaminopimelate desuccinylase-like protein
MGSGILTGALASALALVTCTASAETPPADLKSFRAIYKELVEIDTTDATGDTLRAAQAMAAHLKAGGIPAADVQVISTGPRKGNVVARLRGSGTRRPILLLAHIDVVPAGRDGWDFDPFKLTEIDGYFRGRGVIDDKAMASIFVANLIEYAREGFRPERDIILALTTDEELARSPHNGVRWLLQNRRELIDAEFAVNEGGGGALRKGQPFRLAIQLAEKVYQTYELETTDAGGHSASPRRENPIYRLATALTRLAPFEFPPRLNDITRASFKRLAATETPAVAAAIRALLAGSTDAAALAPLAANPSYNAQMRTTCVATLLAAGQVENALPQSARATVNCRILPDEPVEGIARTLARVIADDKVTITAKGRPMASPPSPPHPEVMRTVTRLAAAQWPGVPVHATMSAGYTDNRWLRNAGIPAYGVSGLFSERGRNGVHGRNERVAVKDVYGSKRFLYALIKELAAPGQSFRPGGVQP